VGLTDVYTPEINYREVFARFLSDLNIKADLNGLRGAFTPIGVGTAVMGDNVFFVGDAAGACDPLTLSGLRYGLKSGEVCAKAVQKGNVKIYKKFAGRLKTKFWFMKIFQKIFYLKSTLFLGFNVICRCFGKAVSCVFNNFFVNKK